MNFFKYFFCLLLILFIFEINKLSSCTIRRTIPTGFDHNEFIFIGKILKIIGPFRDVKNEFSTYGYLVDVKDRVFLPDEPEKYFELIVFGLDVDCSLESKSKEIAEYEFPVGSEVRIVAKKAQNVIENIDKDNIRLEITPYDKFEITHNISVIEEFNSIYPLEFDYSKVHNIDSTINKYIDTLKTVYSFDPYFIDCSIRSQYYYELKKDFFKLKYLKDQKKITIIDRLSEIYRSATILEFVNEYIVDKQIKELLIKKYSVG